MCTKEWFLYGQAMLIFFLATNINIFYSFSKMCSIVPVLYPIDLHCIKSLSIGQQRDLQKDCVKL